VEGGRVLDKIDFMGKLHFLQISLYENAFVTYIITIYTIYYKILAPRISCSCKLKCS
jgi:hypothetical protein